MRSSSLALAVASAVLPTFGQVVKRQSGNLPTITTEGNAFYAGGERWYMRGVAYQPGGAADAADPLLDLDSLRRDVEQFQTLGINAIRIYTIDNSQDHDEGMAILDEAGIYLTLDVNTPLVSLNRDSLDTLHASYNDVYLQSVFATVDAFAGYNNLALFFSGNEVINARNNTNAAPYVKAVTRDIKQYIAAQANRPIPVGYSAADVAQNIYPQAQYFACGEDATARADFFAFNDYSWCDPSSFTQSGWDAKVKLYGNYSLPLFLSEFGCIENEREWNEIAALYSTNMTSVYSGGLVYEYTIEPNGYGLVELQNGQVVPNQDFERLQAAYAATPNPTGEGGARSTTEVPDCPAEGEEWAVETDNLPVIPANAAQYIRDGAGPGPGLTEESSQWAGEPSETEPDLSNGSPVSEDLSNGTVPTGGESNGGGSSNSSSSNGTAAGDAAADSGAGSLRSSLSALFVGSAIAAAHVML
ncbi:hypothetical protein LTR10_013008 [Elasticomyces elasticus]|nr:hypothetical protein LTR10_013008 [Elasticomyces elasticus]KAK4978571.1 hypothetical protein LTR42_001071 [Elasticomyces elasticus]